MLCTLKYSKVKYIQSLLKALTLDTCEDSQGSVCVMDRRNKTTQQVWSVHSICSEKNKRKN